MSALMDFLLALVNVLCGGSTTDRQPSPEHQKPHTERPQQPTSAGARPEYPPPALEHRQEQPFKPTPPAHHEPHHDSRPHENQNQINQHEEHYVALRTKANEQGDLMSRCFQESHEAYGRGEGARAKELSVQGKEHERTMEKLNAEASDWIFRQNNIENQPGEINLHGLYVKEAISYTENTIQEARQRGDAEIRLIVGKGLHSDNRVAKIKPAIEDLMKKYNIPTEVDPHNEGVLVARLR